MEVSVVNECRTNYSTYLFVQAELVRKNFKWLNIEIKRKFLTGSGELNICGSKFHIQISFSPFYDFRFDRILIKGITFNPKIHLYSDQTLCLYHPLVDTPRLKALSLIDIIPWISEWCIHYLEWQKYGVWLGKEIAHD